MVSDTINQGSNPCTSSKFLNKCDQHYIFNKNLLVTLVVKALIAVLVYWLITPPWYFGIKDFESFRLHHINGYYTSVV